MIIPFIEELEPRKSVLIAGAGGGFDLFAGLPLFHWLREMGKTVHLANLTFSDFHGLETEKPAPALARLGPNVSTTAWYCPELHLSRFLSDRQGETPIHLFERTGVVPIKESYEWLANALNLDAIVLIDGGTDSLMRGDEDGLGTPQEDMASLAAVHALSQIDRKYLVCVGFGVDAFHGVCHAHALENMAAIIADDGGRGSWSLTKQSPAFQFYRDAVDYVTARMPRFPSIVNTSIVDATLGWFGDHHGTHRTKDSELFINPLMSIYWTFTVAAVAKRNLYLNQLASTRTYSDVTIAIQLFLGSLDTIRPWKAIPC